MKLRGRAGIGGILLVIAGIPAAALPPGQNPPCVFSGVERTVVVGDLHGALDRFLAILQGTGLVGEDLSWSGGRAHLVQMGDILDRGPDARRIFDLLRRLEAEAEAAGGRVHVLLGNHEVLALMGLSFDYEGFVTFEQYASFLPADLRRRAEGAKERRNGPGIDALWREALRMDGRARAAYMRTLRDAYGLWLAGHNTALRINDVVFVHGGLNESYSAWPLERINKAVTEELLEFLAGRAAESRVLVDGRGPLWYRDLAAKPEDIMRSEFIRVLANLQAKAMVVAHTPTKASRSLEYLSRFDGRLWTVDTGIWDPVSGRVAALLIEGGRFRIWRIEE